MGSKDATGVAEVATQVSGDAVTAGYDAAVQDAIDCLPEAATDEVIDAAVKASEAAGVTLDSMLEVGSAVAATVQAMEAVMCVVASNATVQVETAASIQVGTLAHRLQGNFFF